MEKQAPQKAENFQFNNNFNYKLENLTLCQKETDNYITGDIKIDKKIIDIALKRGYILRQMPFDQKKLVTVYKHRLQPKAAQAYLRLEEAVKSIGYTLYLTSGFRDCQRQRELLLDKLNYDYSDENINHCLKTVAPPGYSKHHSGYTIDIGAANQTLFEFMKSDVYKWLTADNNYQLKKHGWLPSYPDSLTYQGPDPEPWEFVYVGDYVNDMNDLKNQILKEFDEAF